MAENTGISIEQLIVDQFAEVAKCAHEKYGIQVRRVNIDWIEFMSGQGTRPIHVDVEIGRNIR